MSNTTAAERWLSTTLTAAHFGVSAGTVMRWHREQGFPMAAIRSRGVVTEYEIGAVAAWLQSRPPARRRPYKWQPIGLSAQ
jgi:hypothetical protein